MRTTLWICLLTLGVMVLFCESAGIALSCCKNTSKPQKTLIGKIKGCYEQEKRNGCPRAFLIITNRRKFCLNPNLPWLKREIYEGSLRCPPEFSLIQRFEVLDEDDLE